MQRWSNMWRFYCSCYLLQSDCLISIGVCLVFFEKKNSSEIFEKVNNVVMLVLAMILLINEWIPFDFSYFIICSFEKQSAWASVIRLNFVNKSILIIWVEAKRWEFNMSTDNLTAVLNGIEDIRLVIYNIIWICSRNIAVNTWYLIFP